MRPANRLSAYLQIKNFQVMADHATEPFVLHAWLLRRNQLNYG
jgi:hypothetical protein